jgi:hypothetical protein
MTNIKILHLVLYSIDDKTPYYDSMYYITRKYYKNLLNVKTYYYCYSNDIDLDYKLVDDLLLIKGEETYVPGILDKTIKTFEYFINNIDEYAYIVRSDISTIINFDLLSNKLSSYFNKSIYTGGLLEKLNWYDYQGGIINNKYFGTNFIQGTCIIFTPNIIKFIINNKNLLDYSIVDDVALAILLKNYTNIEPFSICDYNEYYMTPNINDDINLLKHIINNNNIIVYRNKNKDRNIDVSQMNMIVNILNNII